MKNKKQGFTLIELLVVVLIIGILSAIALPQYEKAVEKSKIINMLPLYKAVIQANEMYDLEHGQSLAPNFDALGHILPDDWTGTDTNIATNGEWQLYFSYDNKHGWRYIELRHLTGKYAQSGFIWLVRDSGQQHDRFPDRLQIVCFEKSDMTTGQGGFCKKVLGGKYIGSNGSYLYTFPY